MTRKDTILITVIINAGLLAILFVTAVIYETDPLIEKIDTAPQLVQSNDRLHKSHLLASAPIVDEVDHALKNHSRPLSDQAEPVEPIEIQTLAYEESEAYQEPSKSFEDEDFFLITVKKGDMLEKIAKTHHTSVSAIKKANNLQNEKLSIGQTLKIAKEQGTVAAKTVQPESPSEIVNEAIYYTVKQGDNPWKIAKQFNVRYDEILKLNHLDEEKAKSLRVGDRVRVK
ncbi:MAG: LysM peptidoglycan-binding domain-containing protein [Parachlamydia sp.]|jgi:LysM repeat protein|nr:LysM peptidoglycan-binding domain-containing protein [Parachlamydia sp.]